MSTYIVPQRIINLDRSPIIPQSILYVGEPANISYERRQIRRAGALRNKARMFRACGMVESSKAAYVAAMRIIREVRTCNDSIPKHRRVASLGWKGPVW
jgi:hypothetical protein